MKYEVMSLLSVFICEDEEPIRVAEREYLEKQILMEGYDMEIVCCTRSEERRVGKEC